MIPSFNVYYNKNREELPIRTDQEKLIKSDYNTFIITLEVVI